MNLKFGYINPFILLPSGPFQRSEKTDGFRDERTDSDPYEQIQQLGDILESNGVKFVACGTSGSEVIQLLVIVVAATTV